MGVIETAKRATTQQGTRAVLRKFPRYLYQITHAQPSRIGSGRVCPVCSSTFRRFQTAGFPGRKEAECPACGVRERHRLLWLYIQHETNILEQNGMLLHFAPTLHTLRKAKKGNPSYLSVDLVRDDVDVNCDITNLPFKDSSFNSIICSHVLEHIPDDELAISELYRILEPGGTALIMVPKDKERSETYEDVSITKPEEGKQEFGQHDHVRIYGQDFADRLRKPGFNVRSDTYAEKFTEEYIKRFGLKLIILID